MFFPGEDGRKAYDDAQLTSHGFQGLNVNLRGYNVRLWPEHASQQHYKTQATTTPHPSGLSRQVKPDVASDTWWGDCYMDLSSDINWVCLEDKGLMRKYL